MPEPPLVVKKSISHSADRISELVGAVKSYSFMDQAPWCNLSRHPFPRERPTLRHISGGGKWRLSVFGARLKLIA